MRKLLIAAAFLIPLVLVPQVAAQPESGSIRGKVTDVTTGRSVPFAEVVLEALDVRTAADAEGLFTLKDIPAGTYVLQVYRLGYHTAARSVTVAAGTETVADITLTGNTVQAAEVVIEGARAQNGVHALAGSDLRQRLGTTLAETLEGLPGLSMRSMGPAPARPVLRGLSGERLKVLEDGATTGDLSATGTDHALTIDPMNAEGVAIIRGPEALAFGGGVAAGVINVERNYIPVSTERGVSGTITTQGETVNQGIAGGAMSTIPIGGGTHLRLELTGRRTQDLHTPAGVLRNTEIETYSGAAGIRHEGKRYAVGVAAARYDTQYGIPGGFVGAHRNGVRVEAGRSLIETRGQLFLGNRFVPEVQSELRFTYYEHSELESSGVQGVGFDVATLEGAVRLPSSSREIGLTGELRNFDPSGIYFTPEVHQGAAGAYLIQQLKVSSIALSAGVRMDLNKVAPMRTFHSETIGQVRTREFTDFSGGLSVTWPAGSTRYLKASVLRSARAPGIEELYSEGPHLAAYSFEIGNPDLESERATTLELSGKATTERYSVEGTVYRNSYTNYIYPQATGALNVRTLLPEYRFAGIPALLTGAEAAGDLKLGGGLALHGLFSYVRGTLREAEEPLPFIPPLSGMVGLHYTRSGYTAGVDVRFAGRQDRTGAFETATPGYRIVNLSAGRHFSLGSTVHTLDVALLNVADVRYYDHLSRVKSIMPMAGRNLRVTLRTHF